MATTYEVSCYTDPLGIEHLTGSLDMCIRYFGTREKGHLRWVSKFDAVDELLDLPHNGHTRCRMSVNASPISGRFEGGTASVTARLQALRRLALPRSKGGGGYPVGLVIAPIMPIEDWMSHYTRLFDFISEALDFDCDLTDFRVNLAPLHSGVEGSAATVVFSHPTRYGRGDTQRQAQQVWRHEVCL